MNILTRQYIGLLIISILALFLFVGLIKAIFYSAIITVAKYLSDKFLSERLNPFIDKIINWINSKF
jgi:hypothetical protein